MCLWNVLLSTIWKIYWSHAAFIFKKLLEVWRNSGHVLIILSEQFIFHHKKWSLTIGVHQTMGYNPRKKKSLKWKALLRRIFCSQYLELKIEFS